MVWKSGSGIIFFLILKSETTNRIALIAILAGDKVALINLVHKLPHQRGRLHYGCREELGAYIPLREAFLIHVLLILLPQRSFSPCGLGSELAVRSMDQWWFRANVTFGERLGYAARIFGLSV